MTIAYYDAMFGNKATTYSHIHKYSIRFVKKNYSGSNGFFSARILQNWALRTPTWQRTDTCLIFFCLKHFNAFQSMASTVNEVKLLLIDSFSQIMNVKYVQCWQLILNVFFFPWVNFHLSFCVEVMCSLSLCYSYLLSFDMSLVTFLFRIIFKATRANKYFMSFFSMFANQIQGPFLYFTSGSPSFSSFYHSNLLSLH